MENTKIIKLDLSTKILYSLFNFFAPIAFVFIIASIFETYNILTSLFSLISIFIGLLCLILNLVKYNRYLCISDKTINICKGKINNPKVLKTIKTENIVSNNLDKNFSLSINSEKKKVTLLHTKFSLLCLICYIGPIYPFLILENRIVTLNKLIELYQVLPELSLTTIKPSSKNYNIITHIFVWGFVLLVSFLGGLNILFTPFYPFMN